MIFDKCSVFEGYQKFILKDKKLKWDLLWTISSSNVFYTSYCFVTPTILSYLLYYVTAIGVIATVDEILSKITNFRFFGFSSSGAYILYTLEMWDFMSLDLGFNSDFEPKFLKF